MTLTEHISVRAGDTDPIIIVIAADGLSNLDNLDTAVLYLRKDGEDTNHVDGAALAVDSSADRQLEFDPAGAEAEGGDALTVAGKYRGYVKATWDDGDVTRHPGNGWLRVTVYESLE